MKRKFKFSRKEWWTLAITSLITGLILSWRLWGEKVFDFNAGIENVAKYTIFSFIALFLHFYTERYYATIKGYETEYKWNPFGLFIILMFAVIFDGLIPFLAPGYLTFKSIPKLRIGKWRYRSYFREYGYIAFWGICSNLVLASILAIIAPQFFAKFIWANVVVALFSLIPAPFYDGFHIFFASMYQYIFMIIFAVVYSLLFYYVGIWQALLVSILVGTGGFLYYFSKKG